MSWLIASNVMGINVGFREVNEEACCGMVVWLKLRS
jgi:hypothetical protein